LTDVSKNVARRQRGSTITLVTYDLPCHNHTSEGISADVEDKRPAFPILKSLLHLGYRVLVQDPFGHTCIGALDENGSVAQ
jgi:hypothetical protein